MPMQVESLEVLEKAEVPPAQARAIIRAIEIELAGAKDTLATKHDILLQRQDFYQECGKLREQMTELRAELEGQMTQLRAGLEGQIAGLRADFQAQMAGLRGDFQAQMAEMRGDFQAQMAEMRGELRAEMRGSVSGVTRQMYTALLGQTAVLLGFAYFFATHIA